MFICTELMEETGSHFWHVGRFLAWIGQVGVLEKIHTFDEVMT